MTRRRISYRVNPIAGVVTLVGAGVTLRAALGLLDGATWAPVGVPLGLSVLVTGVRIYLKDLRDRRAGWPI